MAASSLHARCSLLRRRPTAQNAPGVLVCTSMGSLFVVRQCARVVVALVPRLHSSWSGGGVLLFLNLDDPHLIWARGGWRPYGGLDLFIHFGSGPPPPPPHTHGLKLRLPR